MATVTEPTAVDELPADNASRIAIYDALADAIPEDDPTAGLTVDELFDSVIPRLRVLVPRELHNSTERAYVEDKLEACIESGLIERVDTADSVRLTGARLQIRYPDGVIREYHHGLEPATERLDSDNARLRAADFDVCRLVPTLAEVPDSPGFKALVASMREHGFLKESKVARYGDGVVIDGRARIAAAEVAGVEVDYLTLRTKQEQAAARRRDTPLHRVLIAIDANHARLSDEERDAVRRAVSEVADRPWTAIAVDLALTRGWRRAAPAVYYPRFEVRLMPYRPDSEPKIQVTPDGKVMLRSLLESAGLTNWKIKDIKDYVVIEEARTERSAGRKAGFAPIADLISGIEAMQSERRTRRLKIDREWDDMRAWLLATFCAVDSPDRPN